MVFTLHHEIICLNLYTRQPCKIKDHGALSPRWDICNKFLPLGLRKPCRRGGTKDIKEKRLPDKTGCIFKFTETVAACPGPVSFSARQSPSTERGSRHKFPLVTQKPPPIDKHLQMKKLFSPTEAHWVYNPLLKTIDGQHKMSSMIVFALFCFVSVP